MVRKLGKILEEDYGLQLSDMELKEFGEGLIATFNLLYEADRSQKFVTRTGRFIDTL